MKSSEEDTTTLEDFEVNLEAEEKNQKLNLPT